jgi:hypothetical protein
MSAAHQRRGTRPPKAGRPWTAEEIALLGTMPDEEVTARTGRTLQAVRSHRQLLGILSVRRMGPQIGSRREAQSSVTEQP